MAARTFAAVIHKEDDLYTAKCVEVGTVSQGYTIEQAIANLKEAIELYPEEFPLPDTTTQSLTAWQIPQRQAGKP